MATCAGGIDDLACAIPSGTEAAAPAVSHVAEVLDGGSRSYLVAPAGVAGCLGTSYTVDGWFLWKGHTAADDANPAIFNPILFSYFQVNGDRPDVVFQIHKGDHLLDVVVDYGGVATRTEFFGVTPISAGVWHHAALIVDNGAVSIFLDGSFEGSSTLNDPMFDMPPGEWWFGMRQDLFDGVQFNGQLDDLRISRGARYTGAFTPSRRQPVDFAVRGLWHLDEASAPFAEAAGVSASMQLVGGCVVDEGVGLTNCQ